MPEHVALYDTTPRNGVQQKGISLSAADKLAALPIPDDLEADFVEGGRPGTIPKDTVFLEYVRSTRMCHTRLVALDATTRPGVAAIEDRQVRALLDLNMQIITLVAKSDVHYVKRALRIGEDGGLRMVRDIVVFLSKEGTDVMVDLEHSFDGLAYSPDYGIPVMMEATLAGAVAVTLYDTNGGSLPSQVSQAMKCARTTLDDAGCTGVVLGIYAHSDTGRAVADTTAAVEAGARRT